MRLPKSKTSPGILQKLTRLGNLIVLVSVWFFPASWMINDAPSLSGVWGEKPVLSYFVLTASWRDELKQETGLAFTSWQVVEYIARHEANQLSVLYQDSQKIANNDDLSLWGKRVLIWLSGYNWQVKNILLESDRSLKSQLDHAVYDRLRAWVDEHWGEEKSRRGISPELGFPRSYEIYATRYDSGGAYTVALPDKCLKFSNAGNHLCDDMGYAVGQNYTVFLSYKKSTAATVLESGPWNVDDNYWAGWGDPQRRRMFADLALGMPEAQAAFFNNYNGGQDQFGRKVTAPFGIDLARQVSIDIGLEPGVNDWITVSFMWTETWDGSSPADPNSTSQPAQEYQVVQTATTDATGAVIHEVKFGQTLWAIADAYQVNLQDLYSLNNLADDAIIIPGQQLLIRRVSLTASATFASKETPRPTRTSVEKFPTPSFASKNEIPVTIAGTQMAKLDSTEIANTHGNKTNQRSSNYLLAAMIGLSIVGLFLLLLGGIIRRQI